MIRLRSVGLTNKQIAEQLGCSAQVVSMVCNGELGKRRRMELQAQRDIEAMVVQERISELVPKALNALEEAVESDLSPFAVKVKAAEAILDRGGYVVPKVLKGEINHGHFTATELAAMRQRAGEAGAILDIELEPEQEESTNDVELPDLSGLDLAKQDDCSVANETEVDLVQQDDDTVACAGDEVALAFGPGSGSWVDQLGAVLGGSEEREDG